MHEITVNLHMHTRYSDGSGLHKDIAAAAMRTGLDAVIVTDHNVLAKDFEDHHRDGNKRVLMLIGQEVHYQARDPQKNHPLIFGANRDLATLAEDPQALMNAVREAGGICFQRADLNNLSFPKHSQSIQLFGRWAIVITSLMICAVFHPLAYTLCNVSLHFGHRSNSYTNLFSVYNTP